MAALSTAHAADDHIGLVKNVTGHVTILRAGGTVEATPGTTVFVADRLRSDAASTAGIVFKDGTLITLGASADLQVRDYVFAPSAGKYGFSAYLSHGTAIYASGRIGKLAPEQVQVQTPTATVGVRGTRFVIEAN